MGLSCPVSSRINFSIDQEEPGAGTSTIGYRRRATGYSMAEEADVGLAPNEDRGPVLLRVTWTMVTMASITVLIRVYCRSILQNAMGWDDSAILAAVVSLSFISMIFSSNLNACLHQF